MSIKSVQLQWRRDKVRELYVKEWTQRDIAAELQIPLGTVVKDLNYFKKQAKKNNEHYIDEYLPTAYENTIQSLNLIIKEEWDSKPKEDRSRIMSRSLIKECLAMRIELIANGKVVDRAIKFIEKHRGYLTESDKVMIDGSTQ